MAKSQISRLVCPSMDSPTIERRGVFPGRAGRHPFLILTTPGCRRPRARFPCPIAPEVRAVRSTRPRRRRSPVRLGAAVLLPLPKTPSHASIQPHPRWRAWNGGKRVSELGSKLGHDRSLLWRRLEQPRSAGCRCATAPICDLCNRDCVNELTKIKSSTICSIK